MQEKCLQRPELFASLPGGDGHSDPVHIPTINHAFDKILNPPKMDPQSTYPWTIDMVP